MRDQLAVTPFEYVSERHAHLLPLPCHAHHFACEGADESTEGGHVIFCADTDLNEVATSLEGELGESESTKLIWKPTTTTELDLEGMQKLMRLVDALEDDDDIQRVTTNFEASDEVMDQL